MSWVSWAFTVKGFFKNALHEVLQLVSVLAGVDFEAAVKIGRDFESRRWWWFGWGGVHNRSS